MNFKPYPIKTIEGKKMIKTGFPRSLLLESIFPNFQKSSSIWHEKPVRQLLSCEIDIFIANGPQNGSLE